MAERGDIMKIQDRTPGPWYGRRDPDTCQSLVYSEATGDNIAVVYSGSPDTALIAAAPELLEILKHVLCASEDGGGMEDINWGLLWDVYHKISEGN
jgi:hypothetical protein